MMVNVNGHCTGLNGPYTLEHSKNQEVYEQ